MAPGDLKPTHGISGDSSTKVVRGLRNAMKDGSFDWNESPISVVRNEGQAYVVDGHHRLAAARLAGLDQVGVRDVTGDLLGGGFAGYSDMADVLSSAASFMGNRLNPYKLR
jgi:ParB-like nuclease domain